MKKMSIGLVISLVALGCESAKPPVTPPMDMSKMHMQMGAPTAGHAGAGGEAKPAEGEVKPAEGEAKPAEGEAKPAEGEAKPADQSK
jgi:hypothetical protein